MKLKCKINGVQYDKIVSGAVFSEEFNETLDSGNIIISHVPQIPNLKPYNDVFIWNADEDFNGYINKGDSIPLSTMVEEKIQYLHTEDESVPGFRSNLLIENEADGIYLSGKLIDIWQHFFFDFTNETEDKCRYSINLLFDIKYFERNSTDEEEKQYSEYFIGDSNGNKHGERGKTIKLYSSVNTFLSPSVEVYYLEQEKRLFIPTQAEGFSVYFIKNIVLTPNYYDVFLKQNLLNSSFTFKIEKEKFNNLKDFVLTINIDGLNYDFNFLEKTENKIVFKSEKNIGVNTVFCADFVEEDENVNIIIQNNDENTTNNTFSAKQTKLRLTDKISFKKGTYLQPTKTPLPRFYKHMLIDSYTEEQLNFDEIPLFKYRITLFSETKALEKIILPNISITQSLNKDKKRNCLFYLKQFVELYSPKIKKIVNYENKEWEYVPKYSLDLGINENSLDVLFNDTICPEMSLTNPTLKDVLSRIMVVKDCIPVVKDDVIYAMKIGETRSVISNFGEKFGGDFIYDPKRMSFPTYSMNSGDYSTAARREYSNAISQENTARYVENLGFRNSNSATLTLSNLQIETRFPIYKINKLYLCFLRKAEVTTIDANGTKKTEDKVFLCRHEISDLILQDNVRNSLSGDWTIPERYPSVISNREEMARYKILTLGYTIGSNKISGWGTTYTFYEKETDPFAWWPKTQTYIEGILNIIEEYLGSRIGESETDVTKIKLGLLGGSSFSQEEYRSIDIKVKNWKESIVTYNHPDGSVTSDIGEKIKSIFFQIDYNAMYNGAIIHSKDNVEDNNYVTTDNCSSALSILEIDGSFEKEKMNRTGNKMFNLQGRFDNYEDLQNHNAVLGSIYNSNIVIYHRQYAIYDNYISANFAGSYDYVMKNYFTTVFAKLRTYNLMSYGESTTRAENVKWYIELDKNYAFYEKKDWEHPDLLFASAFESTETPRFIGFEEKPNLLNGGVFEFDGKQYSSDFNGFVSGNSLCFNIRMYDNVTNGVYISSLDTITDKVANNDVKGSIQEWLFAIEDREDAFIKNIGCYVGHFDYGNYFYELPVTYRMSDVKEKLRKILDMPSFPGVLTTPIIGGNYPICKDNKEILDMTFQFETYFQEKDGFIAGQNFSKLNDLINIENKYEQAQNVSDFYGFSAEADIKVYVACLPTTTQFYVNNQFEGSRHGKTPTIILKAARKLMKGDFFNKITNAFEKIYVFSRPKNEKSKDYDITYNFFQVENVDTFNDNLFISSKIKKQMAGWLFGWASETKKGNILFEYVGEREGNHYYMLSPNSEYYSWIFEEAFGSAANKWFETESEILINETFFECNRHLNALHTDYTFEFYNTSITTEEKLDAIEEALQNKYDTDFSSRYTPYTIFSEGNIVTYPKTMYLLLSDKKINKDIIYDEIDENNLPSGYQIVDENQILLSDVFSLHQAENTAPYILVSNSELDRNNYTGYQSVQYWFKRSDGLLHFVFGADAQPNVFLENKIYISIVKDRSTKVYDEWHNPIAHVVNFADTQDSEGFAYGEGQKYRYTEE